MLQANTKCQKPSLPKERLNAKRSLDFLQNIFPRFLALSVTLIKERHMVNSWSVIFLCSLGCHQEPGLFAYLHWPSCWWPQTVLPSASCHSPKSPTQKPTELIIWWWRNMRGPAVRHRDPRGRGSSEDFKARARGVCPKITICVLQCPTPPSAWRDFSHHTCLFC